MEGSIFSTVGTAATTARQALTESAGRLRQIAELEGNALADATLLLLEATGLSRAELMRDPARRLSSEERQRFARMIERRLRCEPVQYILGRQEFYGLTLRVGPGVLIPRPETELLVEAVLQKIAAGEASATTEVVKILDVGTGSGAIAIALAVNLASARVTAVDISEAALRVAVANAAEQGVGERIRFLWSDLLSAIVAEERFDVVVSNLPYVPERDRATLHPEVRDYEPGLALFAGDDGLNLYRRLIPEARRTLRQGGLLALETGFGQSEAVRDLLVGWDEVETLSDLQGIGRVILARRG